MSLAEYHACNSRNPYPGEVKLSINDKVITNCQENINLAYKEEDFTNYQFLDIFRGRKMSLFNNFRQLNTNKNSKILVIITSHGGEGFIKVRNTMVILSDELHRTLNEMYIKEKYKEMIFVLDTCEGFSLFDNVKVPNVYFVSSSSYNQKAHSYSFDHVILGPTVDKFHYLLYNKINYIRNNKIYNETINNVFLELKSNKSFLETDVMILDNINKNLTVQDYMGFNSNKDHLIERYDKINFNEINLKNDKEFLIENEQLLNIKENINNEVEEIRKFNVKKYKFEDYFDFKNNIIFNILIIIIVINIIISFIL